MLCNIKSINLTDSRSAVAAVSLTSRFFAVNLFKWHVILLFSSVVLLNGSRRDLRGGVWTVPIPEAILPELQAQIRKVGELNDLDLAAGYDGVFWDDAVEKKYPKAPREFVHQWFFPQKNLTTVQETSQRRRWHLHESELQEALYPAVHKAKIPKRVILPIRSAIPLPPTCYRQATISGLFRQCWVIPALRPP